MLSLDISPSETLITEGAPSLPTPIPAVVVNGKKRDSTSLDLKPSTSAPAIHGGGDDGWGSNFWVTLVDPQVRS